MIEFGLPLVVIMPGNWNHDRAGKSPLRTPYAGSGRWEIDTDEELSDALDRIPEMNLAVLGLVVVDTDDDAAVKLAGELGVSSKDDAWILRSRKGWHVLYHPTKDMEQDVADRDRKLRTRKYPFLTITQNGEPKADPIIGLDLIMPYTPAIIPPSIHKSGHVYQWAPGHSPDDISIQQLVEPPVLLLEHWKNKCRPAYIPHRRSRPQQPGNFEEVVRAWLDPRSKFGFLPHPKPNGWIDEIVCPWPLNHPNGDANPSFSVNFKIGVYKCWSCNSTGSLVNLAREFNLPVTTVSYTSGGGVSVSLPSSRGN